MFLWSATWKNTRVPLETEIPKDGKSYRSGSGAKVHFKGKSRNERFLNAAFDKNKYYSEN
ncbi:hypothetical protein BJP43_08990 [Candidatus Williamhamiltonella defendens]|uniref:Uncharacterized protein n=1 Tax=Candidatus Williamhamiltonella defendens TaxID=138072 RepID=A0A2D3TEY1_9ENTR|nr:hypothetical protein BJP43_08990 [Candidatus Hamiltonella defensa]